MPTMRNEVHVCNADNGHALSVDCWCEPTAIRWVWNAHGVGALIVEHEDDRFAHRIIVEACRERDKATPYDPDHMMGVDESWITRALTPPWSPPPAPEEQY